MGKGPLIFVTLLSSLPDGLFVRYIDCLAAEASACALGVRAPAHRKCFSHWPALHRTSAQQVLQKLEQNTSVENYQAEISVNILVDLIDVSLKRTFPLLCLVLAAAALCWRPLLCHAAPLFAAHAPHFSPNEPPQQKFGDAIDKEEDIQQRIERLFNQIVDKCSYITNILRFLIKTFAVEAETPVAKSGML